MKLYIYCRTGCLINPSNDQLVKDEGAQIFYSIRLQTKPIGTGANCENPSQCGSNDSKLWPSSDTTCRTVCLNNPSNDLLVKDKGAQIFYSIRSQTKPIGIGVNCEIPHNWNILYDLRFVVGYWSSSAMRTGETPYK